MLLLKKKKKKRESSPFFQVEQGSETKFRSKIFGRIWITYLKKKEIKGLFTSFLKLARMVIDRQSTYCPYIKWLHIVW